MIELIDTVANCLALPSIIYPDTIPHIDNGLQNQQRSAIAPKAYRHD